MENQILATSPSGNYAQGIPYSSIQSMIHLSFHENVSNSLAEYLRTYYLCLY